MNRMIINITEDLSMASNIQELLNQEFKTVGNWMQEGILEDLQIKEAENGIVMTLNTIDETKAKELLASYPLYKYFKKVEFKV
ncbi:hypothetical protein [Lacihabitans lacunae]|uniref:Muconolactone isomerase domain-containing protein n=1 Tax=Lacihabitans lacunae TaxID=1028214 RepID=A0ABV7YY47_9BACT